MSLPKETLEAVKKDIDDAKVMLTDLKDVITDMRLSGMSVEKVEVEYSSLATDLRHLEAFYDRQKEKAT